MSLTLEEQFVRLKQRSVITEAGCWEHPLAKVRNGQPTIRASGKNIQASHVALHLKCVAVAKGQKVLHSCDNRACFNPDHLHFAVKVGSGARACTKCGIVQNEVEFYTKKNSPSQRSDCKSCCRNQAVETRKQPNYARKVNVKHVYGLDWPEFTKLFEDQHGQCAICNHTLDFEKAHGKWGVDHNHSTGDVRGILCDKCNIGLAKFKDRADLLRKAANYLDNPFFKKEQK